MSLLRQAEAKVESQFIKRWSPRAFAATPITDAELASMMEAARWAPSSFNEQPWVFLVAQTGEDRARFASLLMESNRGWASQAPLLMYALARRKLARNAKPNGMYAFDTGAAWMSLALEAHALGIATHAMGGFDRERCYEVLGVDREKYEVLVAIAAGRVGDPKTLPEELRAREVPSARKALNQVYYESYLPDEGMNNA